MIKITFEFKSVDEAVKFLQSGSLGQHTNANVGVLQTGTLGALTPKGEKDALESITKTDDKLLSARQRRLAKNKNQQEPKPKSPRGRKSKDNKATEPVSDKITDADLAKAASIGAEQITPANVMAILEEFGVGDVSKLGGEQRQEFLDLIDEAIEAEKG